MFIFWKLHCVFPATRILFIAILIEHILCTMHCGYIVKYGKNPVFEKFQPTWQTSTKDSILIECSMLWDMFRKLGGHSEGQVSEPGRDWAKDP